MVAAMELARSIWFGSPRGVPIALGSSGTGLENPYVYDSVAREFEQLEREGLVSVVSEHVEEVPGERLIDKLVFVRLR
jgi:hypothetical protein